MEILVAIIGLVGAVLAGGAVTELTKNYNSRSKILKELEIWGKLPEGAAKTFLYDAVALRIFVSLGTPRSPSYVLGILWWSTIYVLVMVEKGAKFRRDDHGLLRLTGVGLDLPLPIAASIYLLGALGTVALLGLGARFGRRLGRRKGRSRQPELLEEEAAHQASDPDALAIARKIIADGGDSNNKYALLIARALVDAAEAKPQSSTENLSPRPHS